MTVLVLNYSYLVVICKIAGHDELDFVASECAIKEHNVIVVRVYVP